MGREDIFMQTLVSKGKKAQQRKKKKKQHIWNIGNSNSTDILKPYYLLYNNCRGYSYFVSNWASFLSFVLRKVSNQEMESIHYLLIKNTAKGIYLTERHNENNICGEGAKNEIVT